MQPFFFSASPRFHALTVCLSVALLACTTSGVGGSSSGGMASGGGAPAPMPSEPIDHDKVVALAKAHIQAAMAHTDSSLQFLDGASVMAHFLGYPGTESGDFEIAIAKQSNDVIDNMIKRLLHKAQVEEDADKFVTYKASPEHFCAGDTDCLELLAKMPLRLRVISPAKDELAASVLVDETRVELARATLSADKATVTVLLDIEQAATQACIQSPLECVKSIFDKGLKSMVSKSNADKFGAEEARGRVDVTWQKLGATSVKATVAITRAVAIAYSYEGMAYRGDLAPGTVSLQADAATKQLIASVNLGKASVTAPFHFVAQPWAACAQLDTDGWCIERKDLQPDGSVIATLAQVRAGMTATLGQKTATVTGLSIGTGLVVTHGSKTVAQAKLDVGTGLTAGIGFTAKKIVRGTADKAFSATVLLNPSAYASKLDLDSWLVDEQLVATVGAVPDWTVFDDDYIRIDKGSLTLSSTGGSVNAHSAPVGKCIGDAGSKTKGKVGMLMHWLVDDCPQ